MRGDDTLLRVCGVMLLAGLPWSQPALALPRMIAIVEERPSGDWGSKLQNDLRVGFVKTESGWVGIDCTSSDVDQPKSGANQLCSELSKPNSQLFWNIYYRGKPLGVVTSATWIQSGDRHGSTLHIGNVPTVGKRTKEFSGWTDASAHRPLVAVNTQLSPASNGWNKDGSHAELLSDIWPSFRSVVSSVEICSAGSDTASPYVLKPSDLKPRRGWQSDKRELLLNYQVDPVLQKDCDMTDNRDLWFYRTATGSIRILPGQIWSQNEATNFAPSLELVDAGRFAGDGDEQALFFFSGYNWDGYILYYDHFTKFAKIGWHYH